MLAYFVVFGLLLAPLMVLLVRWVAQRRESNARIAKQLKASSQPRMEGLPPAVVKDMRCGAQSYWTQGIGWVQCLRVV